MIRTVVGQLLGGDSATEQDENVVEGCCAVEDGELCGADPIGKNHSGTIKYCEAHAPSEAIAAGGRIEPVEFYHAELDDYIRLD